jgi:hypothetical protein
MASLREQMGLKPEAATFNDSVAEYGKANSSVPHFNLLAYPNLYERLFPYS